MRILAVSAALIAASVSAGDFNVEHVVDKTSGLDARVVTFPAKENTGFSVLDVPKKTKGDSIAKHWDANRHQLIINGGYFESDFSPVGLCRIDGSPIHNTPSKGLSGFVAIDKRGVIRLLTKKDNTNSYPIVIQTGPYVIDPGGKIGIRSRGKRSARRTLVGLTEEGDVVIVVTEQITLYDLALSIKKRIPKLERLLNLDGGISTCMKTKSIEILSSQPVRNYIVKTAAASFSVNTVTLKTKEYVVTYEALKGKVGRLSDEGYGFHLSTGTGTAVNFHRMPASGKKSIESEIRTWRSRSITGPVTKEKTGSDYLLCAWIKKGDTFPDNVTVFYWPDGILFRVDWFVAGSGRYDGENILELLKNLQVRKTAGSEK